MAWPLLLRATWLVCGTGFGFLWFVAFFASASQVVEFPPLHMVFKGLMMGDPVARAQMWGIQVIRLRQQFGGN